MSSAKKQDAATKRFVARLGAAALLHPNDAIVVCIQALIKGNGLKAAVRHYSHMLDWLPE